MTRSKAPSRDDAETTDQPATLLSLPKLPPPTEELRQLRREGVHVHRIPLDFATAERERQAMIASLARLPSRRARMWFWQACTIADWYEGIHEMSEQTLRHDLDRAGEEIFTAGCRRLLAAGPTPGTGTEVGPLAL